mmetsp:Transcript_29247/g.28106  ORF Transcript_29247/g.28106 Transcript_29247/m.28106 type:complete len:316 (-) Transcript_29247:36-983(-)
MSEQESILAEVVAACAGGMFSASALYPLEVLKTKMQAEGSSSSSSNSSSNDNDEEEEAKPQRQLTATEYAWNMYEKGGVSVFYAGVETSAMQSAIEKALYFFAYTGLKNAVSDGDLSTIPNLIVGCMAEWAHLPITLPIDCCTTAIQTSKDVNKAPIAIMMTLLSERGVKGMYKGIQAYTVLCLKPSIQYTIFEQIKRIVLLRRRNRKQNGRKSQGLSAMEAFFLGMLARTVATLLTYPYLRAKVLLQAQKSNQTSESKTNIREMLAQMYRVGGLGNLYQGIGPELTRGVLSAALMMMAKEKISLLVRDALQPPR